MWSTNCLVACNSSVWYAFKFPQSSSPWLGIHMGWLQCQGGWWISRGRKHLWLECGLGPLFSGSLVPVLPLEIERTLTVKHSSICWMFCVLFNSKHDCIFIHCGINKCWTKNKGEYNPINTTTVGMVNVCWVSMWRLWLFFLRMVSSHLPHPHLHVSSNEMQ